MWLGLIALLVVIIIIVVSFVYLYTGSQSANPAAGQVTITGSGFEPATIRIKKGQTIVWLNQDKRPHQIVADQSSASSIDSEDPLSTGDSYSFTFDQTGTYGYHDTTNATNFKGTIDVE